MNRIAVVVVGLVGLIGFATGCGSSSSHSGAARTGTITGSLHIVGGPAPGRDVEVDGTITATDKHGRRWRTETASRGGFTLAVPVGSYAVAATSPHFNGGADSCSAPDRAVVKAGATVSVVVQCAVP